MEPEVAGLRLWTALQQPLNFDSRTDWATNVLLFLPIGFLAAGLIEHQIALKRSCGVILPVTVACLLLSVVIEFGQLWIPDRTCSQNDIVAETLGGMIGATAWLFLGGLLIALLNRVAKSDDDCRRSDVRLQWYVVGLVLYLLLPFDFTVRPAEIYDKFQDGRVNLVPFREMVTSPTSIFHKLGDAFLYVPVGVFIAVWRRPNRLAPRPWMRCIFLGAIAVITIEAAQLLTSSRFSSTTDLLMGLIGIGLGSIVARSYVGIHSTPLRGRSRAQAFLTAAVYSVLLVGVFCLPFDRITGLAEARERLLAFASRPPLAALYGGTEVNALSDMLRKLMLFALLGSLLSPAIFTAHKERHSMWSRVAICCIAGGCLALAIELLQLWLPPHIPDATDVLLATCGVGLGAFASVRPLQSFHATL